MKSSTTKPGRHVIAERSLAQHAAGSAVLFNSHLRPPQPGPETAAKLRRATSPERTTAKAPLSSGSKSFTMIRCLTGLIHQALAGNRELKILEKRSRSPATRFWRGKGRTFPSSLSVPARAWSKPSHYTLEGAVEDELTSPRPALSRSAAQFPGGLNFFWQIGHLEGAAECQGRGSVSVHRRHGAAELLRDPSGRGDCRELLRLMALDKRLETLG